MLRMICLITKLWLRPAILLLAILFAVAPHARAQSTIAGGGAFTLVVKSDGTLWAFGLNNNGQIGDNTTTTRKSPQQVSGLSNIASVAAGGVHSMALTSSGSLYVWGDNLYGQVGDATTTDRKTPVLLSLSNVTAIAAGEFHSLALTSNGDVYAWGRNNLGQIGNGTTTNVTAPAVVLTGVVAIGAGRNHSLAVKSDGTAWAWGVNGSGQLGNNTTSTGATSSPVQMQGITSASKAIGGEAHSFLILSDGTVKGAGENGAGQLGDTTSTDRRIAVTVGSLSNVTHIASGLDHAFALLGDGSLWGWGENSGGELGLGTSTDAHAPVEVTTLSSIAAIAAGWSHSIAVDGTGIVSTWGANASSQLGDGTATPRSTPVPISDSGYAWRVATPVFSVASGTYTANQTVVVTVDTAGATIRYTQNGDEPTETDATVASGGSISVTSSQTLRAKAWKSGMPAGETAVANYTLKVATPTVSPTATTYTTPQNVTMSTTTPGSTLRYTIDGTNPTESSSAYSAAVNTAQTTTYRIIGFKSGWTPSDVRVSTYTMNFGTLAAPTVAPATGSYTGNVEVTMSSPQSGATIRYTTNNTAPTASSPIYSGPLSISTTTTVRAKVFHPDYTASAETSRTYTLTAHTPTLDAAAGSYAPGATVTITAGQPSTDTLRMTVDGGDPTGTSPAIASGTTLLLGNFTLKVRAFRVGAGDSAVAAASYSLTGSLGAGSVAAGGSHTALATPDGRVFVWGLNTNGQLGDLSTTTRATPTVLQSLTGVTKVAAGVAHTLAVTADGRVFAWGNNGSGRLGDGTTTQRTGPTAVPALADVIAVAAGDAHSLALTNDGHVYGWGANASGQLGLGTTTGTSTPTLITSLSDVVAIAAGDTHSLAVTASGQLFTWGANASSRLGDGTTTNRTSPTLIALSDVVAVAAGATHSVALQSNGNVYAWGLGSSGQLGQGSTVIKSTPTLLSSLAGAVSVAAGGDHTIILSADGTVWTVGKNGDGQLGLGTTMNVLTPAQVPNLAGISQIAAGSLHSLAITADNVISTWGRNASSELGDGAATGRSAPETISESDYAWRVAKPTFSIAAGTYSVDQTVVLSSLTPNVVIHYTQDGTEPTELHASVASGGSVVVSATQVLKAKAWKTGVPASGVASNAYTMKVALPTVSPAAATYATPQNVTMATITPGSTLRYTIDGTDPTESSTAYTTAVSVANTTTLRIVGFKSGWTNSDTRIATYTMNFGTLAAPTIDPATGSYTGDVAVTMSSPQSGATIRYTTNNTAPTASSPIYSGPLSISTTTTVRAKVFHPDYTASAETLRAYTLTTHTPTLGTAAGTYAPGSTVTVTAGQPATDTLRMTIDGSDPSTSSPTIASGTTLVLGSFTLKVKAWRTGATDSDIAGAAYALNAPLGPGSVAAGGTHSIIATPDGRVIAWGENGNGQIGNEGTVDRTTPTTLNTITGVTQVAGGLAHTLARTWDGQVYAWGSNTSGRLGDGTTTQRTRPTLLTTLSNIVAVAAGDAHSLALTSDGAVYAWGLNSSGELGLGSTTSTSTPTLIPVLSGIVAIAAGDAHSLAVTSSGQLYAWGNNGSSRLGDGTTTNRTSPVLINLSNVVSVAAGAAHSLAMTSSGAVYAWGLNTNGQLGLGNTTLKSTPTLIPALHASAIAAGDTHSAALRGDGVLVAWGLNSSGQLGDATTTQRTSPVIVTGPTTVSSLAFGDAHSFVVTPDGDVWTWGAGASGQLGDGGVSNRAAPQSVLAGIAWWMPSAPTVDIPSGTYANTQSVVISSPIPGAVIRYTLTGQEPADSDTEATSGASLDISYSAFLRARAFVDGRAGKVVRADYELQSVAPIIDPPTGTYTSAQTVSMTASGPLSVIRYTTDGSDPTPTSTAYSQPFVVSTSQTLKARAFPTNGWPASGASTASLAFNYGQLSAPTAAPSEGVFADPQTVALAASPGATIRFTTNGADPTAASPIYTSPIAVTTGAVTIKARAYHPDWTGSPVSAQAYTIDVAPPTIVATRFPLPMGNWQLTPVTVGFVCSDSVGIATCSSPAIVSLEGAEQTVSGIAVDHVGREATVQVTVNVDLTPPLVTLTAPADGLVTASSTVAVSAEVGDALSGLGVVNCNGVATAVVDGIVTCTATLRPGRNSITVSARDIAGHSSSAGATVTLAGTPTRLTLSPANRTMLVDESATLSLRDDFGMPAPGATWVSSNPSVVSLSPDDPPVLTALTAGTSYVTATKNGLSGVSTIVVSAGSSLPEGTTQWTVAPTPGGGTSWFEAPIYTNRVDETGPDLFMVETNTTTWERRLRAMSDSGEVDWLAASPGVPLMGDMFGGVIAGVEPSGNYCVGPFNEIQRCYTALARFAGPTGTTSWRYDSPGMVDRPAQGPDGTIYVVEHLGDYLDQPNSNGNEYFPYPGEKALVILDGATGEVTARVPLEGDPNREPVTNGPIIGSDGFGYILVTKGMRLTLHRLSREGQVASEVIVEGTCNNCLYPTGGLYPDGTGGLLILNHWNGVTRLTRLDGTGGRTDTPINSTGGIELIGQGGTAYLRQTSGVLTVSQPVMDIPTWTPRWYLPVEWRWLAATPGGGAVAENAAGDIAHFDGTGQPLRTIPAVGLRNPVQDSGGLIGSSGLAPNTPSGLRKVEGTFEDATYFSVRYAPQLWTGTERYGFGNQQRNLAPPQEHFPPLEKGAPGIGPHEAINGALDDLIHRLKTDANLRSKAQEFVLGKVGVTVDAFVTYLERNRPRFYDGTKSTFCYWRLVGGPDGFICSIWNGAGQSVKDYMRTNPPTWALAWRGRTPLHVFFDPTVIGLNAEGKNLGNEALIFHEALHGLAGLFDLQIQAALGVSGPSCRIDTMIQQDVLIHAAGLNSQVAINCP